MQTQTAAQGKKNSIPPSLLVSAVYDNQKKSAMH